MVRQILITALCFFTYNGFGQLATSYHYEDFPSLQVSAVFLAQHPTEEAYFTANLRQGTAEGRAIIFSKVLADGTTVSHTNVITGEGILPLSGITDVIANTDFVYVGVSLFSGPSKQFGIYQFDFDGNFITSFLTDHPDGINKVHSELAFNATGDIVTVITTGDDESIYKTYDPSTLAETGSFLITSTVAEVNNVLRGVFIAKKEDKNLVAFNSTADEITLIEINSDGTIASEFSFNSPDGEMTDFEVLADGYLFLINKEFYSSTPEENPIRYIKTDFSGDLIFNATNAVENAVVHENMTIDSDGDIFICSRGQFPTNGNGTITKISSGEIVYEALTKGASCSEIEIDGAYLITTGIVKKMILNCNEEDQNIGGILYLRHKKSKNEANVTIVGPNMTLNAGDIIADISCTSNNFNDYNGGYGDFSVEGQNTIYTTNLWIGAQNIDGEILGTAATYKNAYTAGPNMDSEAYTLVEKDKWQRVWIVSRAEIDAHIAAYLAGDPLYEMPEAILKWPGNGDPEKGQSEQLARYQDINDNGIYEPLMGEYPLIKGDYCALSIYNDGLAETEFPCYALSERVNVEIFEYVYGFDCADDDGLKNSLFVYYDIINQNTETISDVMVGNFIDMDIAISSDYIGTDPLRGLLYTESITPSTFVQGYMIIGSSSSQDGLDNAIGILPGESPNGLGFGNAIIDDERLGMTNAMASDIGELDALTPAGYYNIMQSIFTSGTHLKYGGNGIIGATDIDANFPYPDVNDPIFYGTSGIDPGFNWSEESAGLPPGDRRAVATSGPFELNENDTLTFDIAYITGTPEDGGGLGAIEALKNNADAARTDFVNNETACGSDFDFYAPFDGPYTTLELNEETIEFALYPNPTQHSFQIIGITESAAVTIYNLNGQIVYYAEQVLAGDEIYVGDLNAGIYVISISENDATQHIKLVKK